MSQETTTTIGAMTAQLSMLDELVQASAAIKEMMGVIGETNLPKEIPYEVITLFNQTEYAILSVRNAVTSPATVAVIKPLQPEETAKAVAEAERLANGGRSASLLDTGQTQQDLDLNEYFNSTADDIVKVTHIAAELQRTNPSHPANDFVCAMTLIACGNMLKCLDAMRPKPADRLHIPVARI